MGRPEATNQAIRRGSWDIQFAIGRAQFTPMQLSEDRAFAVKTWLEQQSPANFRQGRVRVFAHVPTQPLAPNSTADGRDKNRRVEIVLVLGANE